MQMDQIKDGMQVYFIGNDLQPVDSGIVLLGITKKHLQPNHVWVKWDSDGEILQIDVADLLEEPPYENKEIEEQEAVMLLLSLGYTVTKNQK